MKITASTATSPPGGQSIVSQQKSPQGFFKRLLMLLGGAQKQPTATPAPSTAHQADRMITAHPSTASAARPSDAPAPPVPAAREQPGPHASGAKVPIATITLISEKAKAEDTAAARFSQTHQETTEVSETNKTSERVKPRRTAHHQSDRQCADAYGITAAETTERPQASSDHHHRAQAAPLTADVSETMPLDDNQENSAAANTASLPVESRRASIPLIDQSSMSAPNCSVVSIPMPAHNTAGKQGIDVLTSEAHRDKKRTLPIDTTGSARADDAPSASVDAAEKPKQPMEQSADSHVKGDRCGSPPSEEKTIASRDGQAPHPPTSACASSIRAPVSPSRSNVVDTSALSNQQAQSAGFSPEPASSSVSSMKSDPTKANNVSSAPQQPVTQPDRSAPQPSATHSKNPSIAEPLPSTSAVDTEINSPEQTASINVTSFDVFGKAAETTSVKHPITPPPVYTSASQVDAVSRPISAPQAPSPGEPPSALVEQAWQKVTAALEQGHKSIVLNVEPPELGSVRIELSLKDGQLRIQMECTQAESYRQLTNDVRQLESALNQQGLTQTTIDLSYHGAPGHTPFEGEWESSVPTTTHKNESEKPRTTRAPSATSALDLMA